MKKSELRRVYLEKQKALPQQRHDSDSRLIADSFFHGFDLGAIRILHTFIPIRKFREVDTRLIFERLWRHHPDIQIVVPRVDFETNEITSLKFGVDTTLAKNEWDIEEPGHQDIVGPEMIDLVLVPGLCFDVHGHRVGYGKGFYDRFLNTCRRDCTKIGLSFWKPLDLIDDVYEGDVAVDFIVTPEGVRKIPLARNGGR